VRGSKEFFLRDFVAQQSQIHSRGRLCHGDLHRFCGTAALGCVSLGAGIAQNETLVPSQESIQKIFSVAFVRTRDLRVNPGAV
jgi:hypothetical protein